MANKRIEIEHYKHYVDLLAEEPSRKTWRKGIQFAMIAAMLLVVALFVLSMMSGNLATNKRNVLEKPPEKTPATPAGQEIPGGQQIPSGQQIPGGQQLPEGVPPIPNQGRAPSPGQALGLPLGAGDGDLIAQAQPESSAPAPVEPAPSPELLQEPPTQPGTTPAATESGKKAKKPTGPGEETKGIGNLANLANGAGGRGFQLYLLILVIGLCVVLYLPVRKARLEGKAK